ncbi:HIT family protein [Neisseriaceae bacterium B1]
MNCPLCHPQNETILYQTEKWRIIATEEDPNILAFCRIIWHEHIAEMTDLSQIDRLELMNALFILESAMREILKPTKINLASLGNVVPHLHWHVIARFKDDAYFPKPIWSSPVRENKVILPQNWQEQIQQYLKNHL